MATKCHVFKESLLVHLKVCISFHSKIRVRFFSSIVLARVPDDQWQQVVTFGDDLYHPKMSLYTLNKE